MRMGKILANEQPSVIEAIKRTVVNPIGTACFNQKNMTLSVSVEPNSSLTDRTLLAFGKDTGFTLKSKFQFTVLGYQTGRLVREAIDDAPDWHHETLKHHIQNLVAKTTWEWFNQRSADGEPIYWHIKREYPVNGKTEAGEKYEGTELRESVTALIEVPALPFFFGELTRLLNDGLEKAHKSHIALTIPFAHITILTKGSPDGIGLSSKAEFETYKVERW